MFQLRYILLPILGALAAVIAFRLAMPFEATLDRGLDVDDPRALFTYGTQWGAVNRIAFGALICGPFALVLTIGRRSYSRALFCGAIAAALGACVNFVTDSGSDILGIALTRSATNLGSLVAMLSWCVLVPAGISFTIAFAVGLTQQRIVRAIFAAKIAAFASLVVQIFGSVFGAGSAGGSETVGALLRSQIPVWRNVEIAVGIALGITMAIADDRVRVGSIRLIHGFNEFRDWSLDHSINRIGSAETSEIPLFGFSGIEPLHALIVRQGAHFYLDPKAAVSVNGLILAAPVALNPGDQIVIGGAKLAFYTRDLIMSSSYAAHHTVSPAVLPRSQPQSTPAAARLRFGATAQELHLPPGRYSVGRDASNAVCLNNDSKISRRHAELLVTDSGLTLVDLGSKNGTLLNGVPLTGQAALLPGDVFQLGTAKFTYSR